MELILQRREIYGNILFYPKNSLASQLASFMKQKTFSRGQVEKLVEMGFKIILEQEEL